MASSARSAILGPLGDGDAMKVRFKVNGEQRSLDVSIDMPSVDAARRADSMHHSDAARSVGACTVTSKSRDPLVRRRWRRAGLGDHHGRGLPLTARTLQRAWRTPSPSAAPVRRAAHVGRALLSGTPADGCRIDAAMAASSVAAPPTGSSGRRSRAASSRCMRPRQFARGGSPSETITTAAEKTGWLCRPRFLRCARSPAAGLSPAMPSPSPPPKHRRQGRRRGARLGVNAFVRSLDGIVTIVAKNPISAMASRRCGRCGRGSSTSLKNGAWSRRGRCTVTGRAGGSTATRATGCRSPRRPPRSLIAALASGGACGDRVRHYTRRRPSRASGAR